jgi:hypothetical protein
VLGVKCIALNCQPTNLKLGGVGIMVKERLRLFLEKQGVVLPTQPNELKDVIRENPHLKDEILLWATLQFGLPFADTETLNLNSFLENERQTKYAERLQNGFLAR